MNENQKNSNENDKFSLYKNLQLYANAFIKSANRSRRVIIIIVFASVITFIASWNSRSDSWIKSRVNRVNIALRHNAHKLIADDRDKTLSKMNDSNFVSYASLYGLSLDDLEIRDITLSKTYIYHLPLGFGNIDKAIYDVSEANFTIYDTLSPDKTQLLSRSIVKLESIKNALHLCKYRNLDTKHKIIHQWEKWLDLRNDRVTVIPISIFGILIDVNDLELLGGFTFAVLLLWLRFSLSKEYGNLKIVFGEASSGKRTSQLEFCYKYLAMQQVLTTPKLRPEISAQKLRKLWRIIIKALFVLPLIVHYMVWKYDLESIGLGLKTNYYRSIFNTVAGSFFLAAILLLSVLCILISIRIDQVWDKVAKEIEVDS